jgi:1-acyl-sn-glycerol-3-phosphate acyltransferase
MWAVVAVALLLAILGLERRQSNRSWFDFLQWSLIHFFVRFWHGWTSNRPAPLPAYGPALLIANHPGHADAGFLCAGCRRTLHYLQARECHEIFLARHFFRRVGCIPVARTGHDASGLRAALRALQEGAALCVFPEGEINPRGRPMRPWPGAAFLALETGAPVIPAWIRGGTRSKGQVLDWLIPSGNVRVTYGPQIDLSAYHGRPLDRRLVAEVTDLFMRQIRGLRFDVASAPKSDSSPGHAGQTSTAGKTVVA